MRVLVVEDDNRVADFVRRGLVQEGFAVDVVKDGREAFHQTMHEPYDVVVLDVVIPHMDGIDVLQEVRRQGCAVPVLILSALSGVADRVRGLNEGADDYLVKPFSIDELVARVRALLRRKGQDLEGSVLREGDLEMELTTRKVKRNGMRIELTPKESSLLEYMLRHRGIVLTRTMIAEHVWDQHFDTFSNVIDVYVRYLRAKLDDEFPIKLIHTVRGVGYVLSTEVP